MESKKPKRGRSKSVGGQSSAKARKMSQDLGDSDQEMKDKMEAASVLSSLRFLTPQAKEPAESASNNPSAETSLKIPVTYKMSDKNHGNPTSQGTAPSTLVGKPSMKYISLARGSGKGPGPAGQGVVLNEQANKLILMHLYNSLQNRQGKPEAQTSTANVPSVPSNLPSESIIPKSETARKAPTELKYALSLPSVLNPTNPVNKHVVAALKKAIPTVREKWQTEEKPPEGFKNKVSYSRLINKAGFADHIQSVGRKGSTLNEKDEQESEAQDSDSSRKAENTETSLPLKKRRILPQQEENSEITISSVGDLTASQIDYNSQEDVQALLRLAGTTHMTSMISETPTHRPYTGDGFKPIDPSASLRVLSDVKQALTPDKDGDLPLHIAVVHQNNELVKRFVDIMTMSGKSVDRYNKLMQTPLHLAVLVKETDIIISLLQARSDPNLVDRNGCTAMHLAVEKGFLDCLETILEYSMYDCELSTKNFEGYTPLHTAVEQDDIGMMVCLVKHGAYIDAQDGKAGRSVLYYAIEYNRLSMVRYLRDQGSNVDLPNYAGITPLMAPHPANQQKILDIIGKGLEAAKVTDGALSTATMKLPLARLPIKSSLIGPEVQPYGLSRSNSMEDNKPFQSRRSSFSDPIDLSLSDAEKINKAALMRVSPQLVSNNSTKPKYRHGGLVEKHAVLVEQLKSGRSSDYEPLLSISKEKYRTLIALSQQERRKAEALKAAATKAAEAVKVRIDVEKDKRQTYKSRGSSEFDMPTSSDTVVKTSVNKSVMRVHELSEKQKLAKNRMGKESQEAALGLILDSDLSKKLLKLGGTSVNRDSAEKTNINRKEPSFTNNDAKGSSKLFRTKEKLSERTEADSSESPVKSMEVDSPRVSEFDTGMPVLSRQVSVSSDQDKQVSSSVSEIKKDVAAEDSSDIKLSQGFDTNDLEIETAKEKDVADIPDLTLQSKTNIKDSNLYEKMDCFSNSQPITGKKAHEEVDKDDTSSVEVQNDVLQMSEDEDNALVIDERVNDEKGSKSESTKASSKIVERVGITDTNMVEHHLKNSAINKIWKNFTGNKIQESSFVRDIYQKPDDDNPAKPHKSVNSSDESTDSADIDEPVPFEALNVKNNGSGTDKKTSKFEPDISGGQEFEKHEQTKITFYHISVKEPSIDENDKSYENLNEEMMCKVNEETDWETESLATSTPPLLSKFGEIVTIDEQTQNSASKNITSPPKLSHILEIKNQSNEDTDVNGSSSATDQVSGKVERNKHVENIARKSELASSLSTDEYSANLYHKPDSVSSDVNKIGVLNLQQVEKKSEEGCITQSQQIDSAKDKTTETCVKEGPQQKHSSEFSESVEKHIVLEDKSDARNSLVRKALETNTATRENEGNTKNIVDGKPVTVTKAHTLYFYDGSTYRSVKVYIDDTEASSDQFKKMFTGKLSKGSEDGSTVINSKTSLPVVSPSVTAVMQKPCETVTSTVETSTSQVSIKETSLYDRAKNTNKAASYRTAKNSTEADPDKTSVLRNESPSALKTASKTSFTASGSKIIESNMSQLPLAQKTGPKSGLTSKDQDLLQMDTGKLKSSSVVLANNSDMNLTSVVDSTALHKGQSDIVQDLTKKTSKTVSKPTVTQISVKPTTSKQIVIPRTLGMSTGKAPVANSEGTLTRINPDIKSKLSKALQSPSRKLNIVKTDSTERLYPAADLIESPATKEVSLRHQL